MKPNHIFKLFTAIFAIAILFAAIAPVEAATANASTAAIPSFEKFVAAVKNGQAGVVRGVYVPGVLALRVKQQPPSEPGFVAGMAGTATQFGMAASQGVIGLLAHNYSSGGLYFGLAAGQEVRVVYGDGTVKKYLVSAVYQYQALDPNNSQGDLIDLASGATVSAVDVFNRVYSGGDHVTFQTCIQKDGNWTWGRLFVVANPM